MAEKKYPNIAIFDFDGTLVHSDTLLLFLSKLTGPFKSKLFLAYSILLGLFKWGSTFFSNNHDYRTDIKKKWLKFCLKNVPLNHLKQAINYLIKHTKWKEDIIEILKAHLQKEDKIVIATGALDIYILDLLEALRTNINLEFKYDHIICTKAERKGDKLTGNILGPNTVREDKKNLVQLYLKKTKYHKIFGYGNAPSDLPFLELCDQKMII